MRKLSVIFCGLVVVMVGRSAGAQPFFGNNAVAFQTEIGLVGTGVVMNPRVAVSDDHRYVRIGMQLQSSQLLGIENFQTTVTPGGTVQPAGFVQQGFVGGVNPQGMMMPLSSSPAQIQQNATIATSVLSQRGIFLLHVN
jgi:hypothetical protein